MMLRNFSSLECVPQDVVPTPPRVVGIREGESDESSAR